jgi:PAS domain S-box-containing protein
MSISLRLRRAFLGWLLVVVCGSVGIVALTTEGAGTAYLALVGLGVATLLVGWLHLERETDALESPLRGAASTIDAVAGSTARLATGIGSLPEVDGALPAHSAIAAPTDAPAAPELASLTQTVGRLVASHGELERQASTLAGALQSARKDAVRAARTSRAMLEASVDATLVVNHEGEIVEANASSADLFGRDRANLIGAAFSRHFANREAAASALDRARSSGTLRETGLVLRSEGDSTNRQVVVSIGLVPGEGAELPRLRVVVRDVTETARQAEAAERRAQYARSLLDAAVDPLFAVSPTGEITDLNDATKLKTGLVADRLQGLPFVELFTDPVEARAALERALATGSAQDVPLTLQRRDGGRIPVSLNATVYRDERGSVVGVLAALRDVSEVRKAAEERDAKEWVMRGIARLNEQFQAQGTSTALSQRVLSELADYARAQVGALFVLEAESGQLNLVASHAYTRRKGASTRIDLGEGLVGQAALERKQILITDVPEGHFPIESGLGTSTPASLCVTPLLFEGSVRGMIELGSMRTFDDATLAYVKQASTAVAIALEAALARERIATALERAQVLAAELEAQQQALQNTNAELEEQTAALKASEHKLKAQQTEIELSNSELNTKNELLERQKSETEQARKVLAEQAEEVALASKYKSEFLANMSHELRTPLNSLLLLARSLRDNDQGNLTPDQVESASVIFESGSDLLNLINEILDLSKIEAGKMDLRLEDVELADLQRSLFSQFDHMAKAQGLTLAIEIAPDAPSAVRSDAQRLGQVIKNLLGNAIKFTEAGHVAVRFRRPRHDASLRRSGLDPQRVLAIEVEDTGIGIPIDKQRLIFEAFQQADSGDRRRFGGTGLGLSISRELAALLGGEIQVVSEPGKGSTFTLFLPFAVGGSNESRGHVSAPAAPPVRASRGAASVGVASVAPAPTSPGALSTEDDRGAIGDRDHVVLVIEDDVRFARILAPQVRQRGFKCLLATSGEEGLALARQHRVHGVILDVKLPSMDGWAVLATLKQDVSLRHIPVHIVSVEEFSSQALRLGAIGHVAKPIDRAKIEEVLSRLEAASADARKRVLVVEDDDLMRKETVRIIGSGSVSVEEVSSGAAAMEALRRERFHLVVMDLGLPDMQGFELLKRLTAEKLPLPPIIVHTVRELTTDEEYFLRSYADSVIVKDVRSQERLIDEVALFLHRVVRDLPEENRRAILHLHESNEPLRGKKVLIVEDDMRTMFAMARLLASHGVHPIKAENGERALAVLGENPDTDLVLLDMMMPVMDGYEAARRIRALPELGRVPIVALTAKAMKEDRMRCLEAGATDYLSKPVDPERLVSLMRVLLCR